MTSPVDKDTPLRLDRAAEQHTPGPWRLVRFEIMSSANEGCHVVACSDPAWGHNRNGANARLIAAAPEMLEALYQALFSLGNTGANADVHHIKRAPWEMVRAAIAKATGRAFPDGERG